MFDFDNVYLTPPQTPVLIVDNEQTTSSEDDEHHVELELLSVNYVREKRYSDDEESENSSTGFYIRRDLMWGDNCGDFNCESASSCNEKRLRDRALITPLNFSSTEEDYCLEDEDKEKYKSTVESLKEKLSISSIDISYNELLLSPTETESSDDDEIDVVGIGDDEIEPFSDSYVRTFSKHAKTNPKESISYFHSAKVRSLDDVTTDSLSDSSIENETKLDWQHDKLDERVSNFNSKLSSFSSVLARSRNNLCKFENETQADSKHNHPASQECRLNENQPYKRTRRKRNKVKEELSTDAGSSSSEESSNKRRSKVLRKLPKSHNSSEKRRRDVLKCKFIELRNSIPELCDYEKAPKIVILSQAKDLICELVSEEIALINEKQEELLKKEHLTKRIIAMQNMFNNEYANRHSRYTISIP